MKSILFVAIFFGLFSCGGSKNVQDMVENKKPDKLHLVLDENKRITFLMFEVFLKDSINDLYSFLLKNKIFAEGTLKGNDFQTVTAIENNYFYFELSNKEGEKSNLIKVDDPLNKIYEHPGEGMHDLGKVILRKNSSEFDIRFQWEAKWKYLSIYKPLGNPLKLKKIYYAKL